MHHPYPLEILRDERDPTIRLMASPTTTSFREINAALYRLAAEIEERSSGSRWAVVIDKEARRIVLELVHDEDKARGLKVLESIAQRADELAEREYRRRR